MEWLQELSTFTKDSEYRNMTKYLQNLKMKGEKVSMCYVAEGLMNKGYAAGEENMAKLISLLLSNEMVEEAKRATLDEKFRARMYEKYGIDTSIQVSKTVKATSA